jgi:hypothetical protein
MCLLPKNREFYFWFFGLWTNCQPALRFHSFQFSGDIFWRCITPVESPQLFSCKAIADKMLTVFNSSKKYEHDYWDLW